MKPHKVVWLAVSHPKSQSPNPYLIFISQQNHRLGLSESIFGDFHRLFWSVYLSLRLLSLQNDIFVLSSKLFDALRLQAQNKLRTQIP